jgi:oxysterol-binding protein 1
MRVRCVTNGAFCELEFKAEGWGGRNKHEVSGFMYPSEEAFTKKEKPANSYYLFGKYTSFVSAWRTDAKGNHKETSTQPDITIWTPNPPMPRKEFQYYFTKFALNLNAIDDKLRAKLPRSDCRLRPDLRAYEEGQMEFAGNEKFRLEEKQRAARRQRAEGQIPEFEPKYFQKELDEETGLTQYMYGKRRDYWRDRHNGDFDHMEDIF